MAEITIDSFKETLDVLVDANPHARNKGDDFKAWAKENFNCDARISFIKEQRQITNRVSEQFRYFAPIVIFVCVSDVKRDTLVRYILERVYNELLKAEMIGNLSEEQDERLREIRAALMQNRIFPEKVIKYLWDDAFKFNTGAIFDTEENKDLDSLEAVIRMFVYENKGKDRFRVFKSSIRDLLFES